MNKPYWNLEEPRGRILPALLAALVPPLMAAVAAWFVLLRPALQVQEQHRAVVAAASELRSTSRALQRDALLMIFDGQTREKTGGRMDSRIPAFRTQAAELETAMTPFDVETARRLRATHETLADGFAAVASAVRAEVPTADAWRVQQEQVLANEIPAARTNDPVILDFQARLAGSEGAVRSAFVLVLALFLVATGFGVAAAATVLRR